MSKSNEPQPLGTLHLFFAESKAKLSIIVQVDGKTFFAEELEPEYEPILPSAVLPVISSDDRAELLERNNLELWEGDLLAQSAENPSLTFGDWVANWNNRVESGETFLNPHDPRGLILAEKDHAEAWRSVEELFAPYAAKRQLNAMFAKAGFYTESLTASEVSHRDGISVEGDKSSVHMLLFSLPGGHALKVQISPAELADENIRLVLEDGDRLWPSRASRAESGTLLFEIPSHKRLVGAKLQAV